MTMEAETAPVKPYQPPSKEHLAKLAEQRAERRRKGTKPILLAPFDVKTTDCGHWEGKYFVMDLPTTSMSAGGMPFPPSKRQARVSSV